MLLRTTYSSPKFQHSHVTSTPTQDGHHGNPEQGTTIGLPLSFVQPVFTGFINRKLMVFFNFIAVPTFKRAPNFFGGKPNTVITFFSRDFFFSMVALSVSKCLGFFYGLACFNFQIHPDSPNITPPKLPPIT